MQYVYFIVNLHGFIKLMNILADLHYRWRSGWLANDFDSLEFIIRDIKNVGVIRVDLNYFIKGHITFDYTNSSLADEITVDYVLEKLGLSTSVNEVL